VGGSRGTCHQCKGGEVVVEAVRGLIAGVLRELGNLGVVVIRFWMRG